MVKAFHNFASPIQRSKQCICTIVAIDVSPSMGERDYPPSRLEAAMSAVLELLDIKLELFPDDYVGLVKFSGSADIVQAPLQVGNNHGLLKRQVLEGMFLGSWTNIAAGLKQASNALSQFCPVPEGKGDSLREFFLGSGQAGQGTSQDLPGKIQGHVVLLTDGDHNCPGFPRDWANRLKGSGVIIDCIGIGGSPSDVNERLLRDIASIDESGQPRYRFIADRDSLLLKFREMAKAGYLRKA